MRTLFTAALAVLVLAGLLLGLTGAFGLNLIEAMFGADSVLTAILYILAGLAAIAVAVLAIRGVTPQVKEDMRPDAANPPANPDPTRGRTSRAGSTPAEPKEAGDPKEHGTTGSTGTGPRGTE